ncbi:MAG: peptidase domain-containing ABC transporter [Thalassospira sp.]|uniref:peptidase domain-containing ABC transporter n=1 Tax=Thalassospira sp. TaxID=1912094 RepID=UPI003A8AFAC6
MSKQKTPDPQTESGIFALANGLAVLGLSGEADQIKHESGGAERPLEPSDIIRCAKKLGAKAKLVVLSGKGLESAPVPFIARGVDGVYFLVAQRNEDGGFVIGCFGEQKPRVGTSSELQQLCTGEAILLGRARVKGGSADVKPAPFGWLWFLPFLKKYRASLSHAMAASLFIQVFALITPLFVMAIIDKVLSAGNMSTLDVLIIGLVAIAVFDLVIGGLRQYVFSLTTNKIDAELGASVFRHLTRLPMAYFASRRVGDTAARVKELETIRSFLTGSALTAFVDFGFTFVFLFVMFGFAPILATIVVGFLVAILAIYGLIGPFIKDRLMARFQDGADSQSLLVEAVSGMETVKALGIEPQIQRQWEEQIAARTESSYAADKISTYTQQAAGFLNKVLIALTLWLGASMVIDGGLTAGQLIAFNMLVGRVTAPAMRIAQLLQQLAQTKVALRRVADIVDAPTEPSRTSGGSSLPKLNGHVRFDHVTFRYQADGAKILDDVSFDVKAGQVIGLVGVSGAGKTTLLRLLQRFYPVEGGRILVDGMDISAADPAWLRRQIGAVLQDNFLFNRTVRENIAIGRPGLPIEYVVHAAKLANAHEFIVQLPEAYDTVIGERGALLSGGQKQRLALARALVTNPAILLLDEATSSLDSASEKAIQDRMQTIAKGRTVFIAAHRLSTLYHADRILVLDNGRLVEAGSHQDLLKAGGAYARMHAIQAGLGKQTPNVNIHTATREAAE